jgi:hypothetical protein
MISLKSYCGLLAPILGMTPDSLYERQRVLTRGGYLTGAIAGKGPGSGIRATVPNVTRLLLSTLATDTLSEIEAKTRKLAAIKQVGGKFPLIGDRFQSALEKILGSPDLSNSVFRIEVRRENMIEVRREEIAATITHWMGGHRHYEQTAFGRLRRLPTDPPSEFGRHITATLEGWCIKLIADDLQNIATGAAPTRLRKG